MCGTPLPSPDDLSKHSSTANRAEEVDVVRHHHSATTGDAVCRRKTHFDDVGPHMWIRNHTRSMQGVQPPLSCPRELPEAFHFLRRIPWGRVPLQPLVALLAPSRKKRLRQRIHQSKREEIRASVLLPMRKVVARLPDASLRIKECWRVHGDGWQSRQKAGFQPIHFAGS